MKKLTGEINFHFGFDPDHKGAHYTLDGIHFMNNGDFAEISDKALRGYSLEKDANTAYNVDSDISELHISVKSSKATLVNMVLGQTYEEVKETYFKNVASTSWDWVVTIDDHITVYNMNRHEFSEFMDNWAGFDSKRKTIRFKSSSSKMVKWLEDRV